jgi:hypothetical protein
MASNDKNPDVVATDEGGKDLSDAQMEVNGVVPGEGGGTADIAVEEDGNEVVSTVSALDFVAGVNVSNPTGDTVQVDVLVDTDQLADGAVATAKLAASAVTQNELDGNSVGTTELIAGAVKNTQIALDAVDTDEIKDKAVDTARLAGSAVTAAKLAADTVGTDAIDLSIAPTWTGEHDFEGGITGLPTPDSPSDAATKQYADALKSGFDYKDPVEVTSDGTSVDLSSATDPNPIDGYTLSNGDRILLKDQNDGTENGIWVAMTATDPSTWVRGSDADEDSEVTEGLFTYVENGTINGSRSYILITENPTLGTDTLEFTIFADAGSYVAGDHLSKNGNEFNVQPSTIPVGDLQNVSIEAMLEGLDADKPSPGTEGRYYRATDSRIIYRDDGTSWNAKGGMGTQDNPLPEQYVESFHTGDLPTKIRTTDSETEIETKLNDNRIVAFEAGKTYDITTVEVTDPGDTLIFGQEAIIQPQQTDSTDVLRFLHSGSGGPKQVINIQNLTINGNGSEGTGVYIEGHGFDEVEAYTRPLFHNVEVNNCGNGGISLYQCWQGVIADSYVHSCGVDGIFVSTSHDCSIANTFSQENGRYGLRLYADSTDQCGGIRVEGGSYEDNQTNIYVNGSGTDGYGGSTDGKIRECALVGVGSDQSLESSIWLDSGINNFQMTNVTAVSCNQNDNSGHGGIRIDTDGNVTMNNVYSLFNYRSNFEISGLRNYLDNCIALGIGHGADGVAVRSGGQAHIQGGTYAYNDGDGIYIGDWDCSVVNAEIYNNGQGTGSYGMHLDSAQHTRIIGVRAYDNQSTTKTQDYAIGLSNSPDENLYGLNVVTDNGTGAIDGTIGSNSKTSVNLPTL